MFAIPARLALGTALVAGSVFAVQAPASAAGSCIIGKWKLAKYALVGVSPKTKTYATGGEGIRLTISRLSAAYDFTGSKKTVTNAVTDGKPIVLLSRYTKRLTMKASFKGGAKGHLYLKPKTATGDATVTTTIGGKSLGAESLVKIYRKGEFEQIAPPKPSFICIGKTLKFHYSSTDRDGTGTVDLYYRRS